MRETTTIVLDILRSDDERRAANTGPCAPWSAWLVCALARQVARQEFLMRVRDECLADSATDSGHVPGMPGWTYDFHGIGLCLVSPDGEAIDCDFHDPHCRTINPYFFTARLESLRTPDFPEARLLALAPSGEAIVYLIRQLGAAGELVYRESRHVFRVAPELEERAALFEAIDFSDVRTRREWAHRFHDYEYLGGEHADLARLTRRNHWLTVARDPTSGAAAIAPLEAMLEPAEAVAALAEIVRGPIGPRVGDAVRCLRAHPEWPLCAAATELLDRLRPEEDHPFSASEVTRYLFERGVERERAIELLLAFAAQDVVKGYLGNPLLAELAITELEHATEHALPLVRKALRSSTPIVHETMVDLLSALDEPWCMRELADSGHAPAEYAAIDQDEQSRCVARLRGRRPPGAKG